MGRGYYDPVAGVFLSADTVQGNGSGENPYGYVGGNPETRNDPTGTFWAPEKGGAGQLTEIGPTEVPGVFYAGTDGMNLDPSSAGPTAAVSGGTVVDGPITYQYSVDPNTGELNYQVYENGQLRGGGTLSGTDAANWLQTVTNVSSRPSGGSDQPFPRLDRSHSPKTLGRDQPQAQTGSGGSGGAPPNRPPTAPPPGGPGGMDPRNIRFTQDACSNKGKGYTVEGNIAGLRSGSLSPYDMPPIRVFRKEGYMDAWGPMTKGSFSGDPANLTNGLWYTLDNRRLVAFQEAGITDIPVIDVSGFDDLIANERWKFDTTNGGIDIVVRRGGGGC